MKRLIIAIIFIASAGFADTTNILSVVTNSSPCVVTVCDNARGIIGSLTNNCVTVESVVVITTFRDETLVQYESDFRSLMLKYGLDPQGNAESNEVALAAVATFEDYRNISRLYLALTRLGSDFSGRVSNTSTNTVRNEAAR
jgi:hypothetical protein